MTAQLFIPTPVPLKTALAVEGRLEATHSAHADDWHDESLKADLVG
jgi:hypothetical protein